MPKGEERVNEELTRIERIGKRMLTDEEKAVLEEYAESTGEPKTIFQVYDDTDITDGDCLGTKEAGPRHLTTDAAVAWAEGQGFLSFSVYKETRCCTKGRKIWYMAGGSPVYSAN